MPDARYRCIVQFDAEKQVFRARTPELEHCQAEGPTRAEAMARLEEEMDAQVGNMREQGAHPPTPVDEESFTGEIQARVSSGLHRELAFLARSDGIELGQLLGELLATGLEARRGARGGQRRPAPADTEGDPNNRGPRDRLRQGFGGRYHGIMDDRANFIEYVRGLDQGTGGQAGGAGAGAARHGRRRRNKGGPQQP